MSPSVSFDWRSFPDYLDPDSPLNHHPSSLPHPSAPIAMSFPVQTTYPYSFHDSHLPVNVNPSFSYPSPELDLQHILDIPIGNHLLHDSQDPTTQPALLSHHAERNHDPILSPVSVHDFMTPCHSPVDVRSPLEYPSPAQPLKPALVHTILPSSFPENHVINFDVSVRFLFSLSRSRSLNSIAPLVVN